MAQKIFMASCSQLSRLMGQKGLGATGEKYVKEFMTEQFCGYKLEFANKYTKKGIAQEDEAIDLVSDVHSLGMILKNTERKENLWYTGECDLNLKNSIDDIKCSWNAYTFPLFDKEADNFTYICQGNGYLDLWDKELFRLHYCLVDAPEWLITQQYWYNHRDKFIEGDEVDEDLYEEVRSKMIHSHIPKEKRVKTFEIKRDDLLINKMRERVEVARDYQKSLF